MCDKEERKALWNCIAGLVEFVESICHYKRGPYYKDILKRIEETIADKVFLMLKDGGDFKSNSKALLANHPELFRVFGKYIKKYGA